MRPSDLDHDASPAWIELIDLPEATGELAEAYERIGARGTAARIVAVQSLHPAAMAAHIELYRTVMFGASPLSRAQREAIAVVVSAANDCFY